MNKTQYFKHNNFLVVQNGEWNDTFDLNKMKLNGEFRFLVEYLEQFDYSEHSLQRVSNLLYHYCKGNLELFKEWYGFTECIIPNLKVTMTYESWIDGKARFAFFLNHRFVFSFYPNEFIFVNEGEIDLTNNHYCKLIFESSKEVRNQLNEIIKSLNTLAKYDAN